jgi:hypothetical protein
MLCLLLLSTSFGRLPCFSPYRGITNATHDTLVSLFYWKYAPIIRLVLRLVDAGWLAPIMSGGTCPIFPVAVEFFSCASIRTLVYIRER